eukprot:3457793-Prymnesium_polylepis.2
MSSVTLATCPCTTPTQKHGVSRDRRRSAIEAGPAAPVCTVRSYVLFARLWIVRIMWVLAFHIDLIGRQQFHAIHYESTQRVRMPQRRIGRSGHDKSRLSR